jgi:hypothetical protein
VVIARGVRRLGISLLGMALGASAVACGSGSGHPAQDARSHAKAAHQLSVTLRLVDPDGSLMHEMTTGSDPAPRPIAQAIEHGSITVDVAATDGKPLFAHRQAPGTLAGQVKEFNIGMTVRAAGQTIIGLRIVNGVLYGTADLDAMDRLGKAGGSSDFLTSVPPQLQPLVTDLRAGKWVQLPLASYMDVAQGYLPPSVTPQSLSRTSSRLLGIAARDTSMRETSSSGDDATEQVTLHWRQLLKDEAAVLSSVLPSGAVPGNADAMIAKTFTSQPVRGTLVIRGGHYRSLTVPLEQFVRLAAKPTGHVPSFGKAALVVDVNDQPAPVRAPAKVSTFRIGQMFGLG